MNNSIKIDFNETKETRIEGQTINIKGLIKDNSESRLKKMKDHRKKLMQLIFKRDFKNLRMELSKPQKQHSH